MLHNNMQKLYFATGNKEKVKEAQAILQVPIEIVDIEIDEVQSMDLEYVAKRKAEEAFKILQKPVITDDVGFKIEVWNGFPGPLVKHLLNSMGIRGLLKAIENETNRGVIVQNAIGYHDGQEAHVFIGEFRGTISAEERGKGGWGFDVVVIPEGEKLTLAELGTIHKNKMSHRFKSLQILKEFLHNQNKK